MKEAFQQVSTLLGDIEELKLNVASLEGRVDGLGQNIFTVEKKNKEQDGEITAIQTKGSKYELLIQVNKQKTNSKLKRSGFCLIPIFWISLIRLISFDHKVDT